MKLFYHDSSLQLSADLSRENVEFLIWMIGHKDDERIKSILILVREYHVENDSDEKENILRTLVELLENKPVLTHPV